MRGYRTKQQGAVSLFVVIFSALLITTITVAFVRLMTQNQMQASLNDLSKSALDSAYAGIEDAKRALVTYKRDCTGTGPSVGSQECLDLVRILEGEQRCETLQEAGIAGSTGDKEVIIKQAEGDEALQQAYTCVKIQLNTENYVGSVAQNTSRLIPLKAEGPFNEVKLEWYSQDDLRDSEDDTDSEGVTTVNLATDMKLPKLADWPSNRPALLRVQLVQFGNSFNLSDFDRDADGTTNNLTLFLMPSEAGLQVVNFISDDRRSTNGTPDAFKPVSCKTDFSSVSNYDYACEVTLQLPNPVGESDGNNRRAYLRVSQIYNPSMSYQVSLANNSVRTNFKAVQPVVDSTGRANDLFRRVRAHIDMETSNIPPLESAIDVSGSLCKTFLVTDRPEEFNPGDCN